MLNKFTKEEVKVVLMILFLIVSVSLYNLNISLRKARDARRRDDLWQITNALHVFQVDFGYFPPSTPDGKILACKGENFEEVLARVKQLEEFDREMYFEGLAPCEWGQDTFRDVSDESYEAYIPTLPQDPNRKDGVSYLYFSNTKRYQIYTYLEGGESEAGYQQNIVDRKLGCGNEYCNYGKSYSDTPLEKSIEEYENELLELKTW